MTNMCTLILSLLRVCAAILDAIHSCFDVRPTADKPSQQHREWKEFWNVWKGTPYYEMSKVVALQQHICHAYKHAQWLLYFQDGNKYFDLMSQKQINPYGPVGGMGGYDPTSRGIKHGRCSGLYKSGLEYPPVTNLSDMVFSCMGLSCGFY